MKKKQKFIIWFLLAIGLVVVAGCIFWLNQSREIGRYHEVPFQYLLPQLEGLAKTGEVQISPEGQGPFLGGLVPHHLPVVLPLLTDFYLKLKANQAVPTFIILGPDHVDAGRANITISEFGFSTPYGILDSDRKIVNELIQGGTVVADESAFINDHSILSQIFLISRFFPEAKVVPIVFRAGTRLDEASALGHQLANFAKQGAFLVGSIDFSHYLTEAQARPIDELSTKIIRSFDSNAINLVATDSRASVSALLAALADGEANNADDVRFLNTYDFNTNQTYTTGYITGFFSQSSDFPDSSADSVSLIFGGDVMLSRNIGEQMAASNDWILPFRLIKDTLVSADLAFINLESPISDSGEKAGSVYSFRADSRAIQALIFAGIDVVSFANNHVWDYGAQAFNQTLNNLKSAGIGWVGAGEDFSQAHQVLIKEVGGLKIAYLAYTDLAPSFLNQRTSKPAVAYPDEQVLAFDIKSAKSLADFLVVSFHFGDEYQLVHNSHQEKLAHLAVESGADLIIGHHPHVVEDFEKYRQGLIAYSLGNLVFDQNFGDTKTGVLLRAEVSKTSPPKFTKIPIKFNRLYQPYLVKE